MEGQEPQESGSGEIKQEATGTGKEQIEGVSKVRDVKEEVATVKREQE